MATYESYKDSGVKWLGQIPSHWDILPGKAIFEENKTKNTTNRETFVLSLSYGNIIPKLDINEGLVPENYSGYQIVEPGYIIIRCTDLQNDKVSLRTGHVNHHGIISGAYLGLKVKRGVSSRYMHYLLHNWDVSKELYRYGSGLRQSLSWADIKYLLLALPPMDEQEVIVAYLDKVTGDIDRAIEAQQKMIDALNERKQIIITRAVTRGLNPDAPLRDSGIDWLGQIPEHWSIRKIKYFARLRSGKNLTSEQITPDKQENLFPVFGGNGLRGYYTKYNTDGEFAIIGRQGALCGNINYAVGQFWATDHAVVCTPIFDYPLLWFGETLKVANLNQYATQSAQPGLSVERVKNVSLPCPPNDEMASIAVYIQKIISDYTPAINQCERMIFLLQERKQIIINEVVTGKTKVI